jgi:hypothetical protein
MGQGCNKLVLYDKYNPHHFSQQDPRFLLNFCISGLFYVEFTETLYDDNPEIQNSAEIGDLAAGNWNH